LYNKVDTNLNFVDREREVLDFWKAHNIAQKAIEQRDSGDTFTFYDGPPTANGKPHIGHVLTRVIKDMLPRYQSMKGRKVLRKAGWDTHGLPVELEVEKAIGINGKEQIEDYGIEPFIKKCRESVWRYKAMWEEFSDVVGFWADMEHPYITYENNFIESEWWALKEIWKKGLLYQGHKIVPYCPRCGTPLSSHEVAQGYKDVTERSAIVRFKAVDEDAYFLAWTTTPWTLPSNLGLCVNPNVTYVKVRVYGKVYYLAEALMPTDEQASCLWNAATMELGALVCTAKSPTCSICPIRHLCAWVAAGKPEAEYTPQGQSWHGTDRQLRGAMMAVLREAHHPIPKELITNFSPDIVAPKNLSTVVKSLRTLGSSQEQIQRCYEGLLADGLASEKDDLVSL